MLPAAFQWLEKEPGPQMLLEALKLFGTVEAPGKVDSPIIIAWAKEVGLERVYTADAIPWCGLFMAVCAKRAGKLLPAKPLWALSWGTWGQDGGQPELGDVLVFIRPNGGHVGFYVGEDASYYYVLGGNQRDAVSIARIPKERLRACRQEYQSKPSNVRTVILAGAGPVSRNEV